MFHRKLRRRGKESLLQLDGVTQPSVACSPPTPPPPPPETKESSEGKNQHQTPIHKNATFGNVKKSRAEYIWAFPTAQMPIGPYTGETDQLLQWTCRTRVPTHLTLPPNMGEPTLTLPPNKREPTLTLPPNKGQPTHLTLQPNKGQLTRLTLQPNKGQLTHLTLQPNKGEPIHLTLPPNKGQPTHLTLPPNTEGTANTSDATT